MDLNSLIEQGRKIRKDLRYVHPSEGVIRLFDVYALGDAAEYHSWLPPACVFCIGSILTILATDSSRRQ